jgi:hypothetical protein
MARDQIHLSAESWSTLRQMADGSSLTARRVFPQPHTFHLTKLEGGEYAKAIAPLTIDELLRRRLLDVTRVNGGTDRLIYHLTQRGADAAARGSLFEEDSQLPAFEEAP